MATILPNLANGKQQFLFPNGSPLANGTVAFYNVGTLVPANTWQDYAGTILNANPLTLDANGQAVIFGTGSYRQIVKDVNGLTIWDQVITDGGISGFANTSDMTQGVALIGGAGRVVNTIAILRTLPKTGSKEAFVLGYTAALDGGGGHYALDPNDTTSADNGGTIIVATDGGRWKLVLNGASVSARVFGAKCDKVTDDTAAITAAFTAFGTPGGTVTIPNDGSCYIASNLTIPASCSLAGPKVFRGTPGSNAVANYAALNGAILLNSAATITLNSGSELRGLLIYRSGMTFPAADGSLFTGTAVTISGDDAAVYGCMILGFNKAIYSNGAQRPRIEYLFHDNTNGIEVTNCGDIPYIENCHAWPFATIATGAAGLKDTRQGTAYYFHDLVDWGKLTNCFSWGYLRGFQVNNANSCTLLNCGTDNLFAGTPQLANSIGVEIFGSSQDTRIIGHEAAAQATAGIHINTSANLHTEIINPNVWGGSTHGILIDAGDVVVLGGCIRAVTNAITYNTPAGASRVFVDHVRFQNITGVEFLANVSTALFFIGQNNDYGDLASGTAVVGGNCGVPTIASAATIAAPPGETDIIISGVAGISAITGGSARRELTLYFLGVLTITSLTTNTNSIRLSGGANFTTSAGGTLTIRHNGTQWFEKGRSA